MAKAGRRARARAARIMRLRLAADDGTSTTAADGEAPAGTLLRLPSDVVRQVAAFTFAAPTSKSCSIMYDGQRKRRDGLEGSRHAAALVVAIPNSHDELRRALRADLDKAERARGFGLTVAEGEAWLRAHGYGSDALATPRIAGERILVALSEFTEDRTCMDYLCKSIAVAQGACDASELVLRHSTLTDEVRALLAYGAVPDCQDEKGETPLHRLFSGHIGHWYREDGDAADPLQIAEYLFLAGADANIPCALEPHYFGRTVLGHAFKALQLTASMASDGLEGWTGLYDKMAHALDDFRRLAGLARILILNGANVHEAMVDAASRNSRDNKTFDEILSMQLKMLSAAADVLLPGHPTNRRPIRYCLHRLKVLHALFSSCSMLQDPATRCDLDEVLSFYDVGPKTPDEHEKFLIEFSNSFAGCRDGDSSS